MRRKVTRVSDGRMLFEAYARKCAEKGVLISNSAVQIGLSDGYIRSLARSARRVDALTMEVFRAFAEFLELPLVQVLLMSGVVDSTDFIFEVDVDKEFDYFLTRLREDAEIGPLMGDTEQLKALDKRLKVSLMMVFERAFKVRLLEKVKPVEEVQSK